MLRMCASNSHSYTHLIQALGIVRQPTVWVFISSQYPGIHDTGLPSVDITCRPSPMANTVSSCLDIKPSASVSMATNSRDLGSSQARTAQTRNCAQCVGAGGSRAWGVNPMACDFASQEVTIGLVVRLSKAKGEQTRWRHVFLREAPLPKLLPEQAAQQGGELFLGDLVGGVGLGSQAR